MIGWHSNLLLVGTLIFFPHVAPFSPPSQKRQRKSRLLQSTSPNDYLTSLSQPYVPDDNTPPPRGKFNGSYDNGSYSNGSSQQFRSSPETTVISQQYQLQPAHPSFPPPQSSLSLQSPQQHNTNTGFSHAPLSYFDLDLLTPKGPRANADVGQPHDATRRMELPPSPPLSLNAGSWWCAAGGWPSSTPRSSTEIFWVLAGRGCVTDQDGMRHYFGPGDTVVLPLLWTGRWDVLEPIHKVWAVQEHPADHMPKEVSLRAVVRPYHELLMMADHDDGQQSMMMMMPPSSNSCLFQTRYTHVGCNTYPVGSVYEHANEGATEWWHILEGVLYLTNAQDGAAQRCVPGDSVVVPAGWQGHADIMETVKMLCVQAAHS